ncbi:hypothetical protein ASG43_07870 [Aureimonas sp. Leaf454]|nr:hypothetical protein ASG43_07870 [Aureimonas sp. Leaf454]
MEVIWTTGASVRRRDFRSGTYYNEILEVSEDAIRLDRLNAGAAFLDTHDDFSLRSVIGNVIPGSARVQGGKGYARVALSPAEGDRDVVAKIKAGIIRNCSVGYTIHRVIREAKEDGTDEDWRVVDWEPMEISAVPIPADAGSLIRSGDKDGGSVVEIVTVDGLSASEARRARMVARHAAAEASIAAVRGRSSVIARAIAAGVDESLITEGFRSAIEIARLAADGSANPLEAAKEAYRVAERMEVDEDERGAAFALAFMMAAGA